MKVRGTRGEEGRGGEGKGGGETEGKTPQARDNTSIWDTTLHNFQNPTRKVST